MTPSKWKALPTLPRVLGALYALFIGMFALDALGAGDFWTSAGAFGIHLIPAAFLVGVLAVAWYNELAGGVIYVVLGLAYVLATNGRMAPSVYVMISGVLLALGTLFLASWVAQRRGDKGGLAPR
jgi:hypothetical protein